MSKKCPVCGETMNPDISDAEWRICKKCRRQFKIVYRKRRCLAYLGNKCSHCGRNDIDVLTFHHRDPKTKLYNIAEWVAGVRKCTWEEVTEELDKCEILCLNCHKLVHSERKELKEFIPFLTQKQRRELESDVITDDELEVVMDNHEAMSDILMETEDIPVRSSSSIKKSVQREYQSSFVRAAEIRAKQFNDVLGIVPPKENKICCYCGEHFETPRGSLKLFCSDYCKEQAKEEAICSGNEDLFDYLMLHGFPLTGSMYRLKEKAIRRILNFVEK